MNTDKTYIKVTDNVNDDNFVPSDDELMLDNYTDEEYSTPYTDNFDDITDVGGFVEGSGSIFDDR